MKEKSPAIQWYPKQALGDDKILAMDWDSKGMHYTLCWISCQQEPPGTIPDDDAVIRRWLGSPSDDVWRRVRPQIMTAWPVQDSRRVNAGMVRAFERQRAFSESRTKAAECRWNAYAVRKTCESTEDEVEVALLKPKTTKEVIVKFDLAGFSDLIYGDYPRKVGRGAAIKAIHSAVLRVAKRNHCSEIEAAKFIHDKVLDYSRSPAGNKGTYTPHCATWMNQSRFDDDTKEWNLDGSTNGNSTAEAAKLLGLVD